MCCNTVYSHIGQKIKSRLLQQVNFLTSSSNKAEKFLRKRCLKTSLRDFLFFPRTAIHIKCYTDI